MRAFHINAKNKSIDVVDLDKKTWLKQAQACVEGYIERAHVKIGGSDYLYVNEEGLYKDFPYGFTLDGESFAGNGLIAKQTKHVEADIEALRGRIRFHNNGAPPKVIKRGVVFQ